MGIAAYNRGSSAIREQADRLLFQARNTLDGKAHVWKSLLKAGAILTFKCNDGAMLTAGPNHHAVAYSAPEFAIHRYGGKWAGDWEGSAWGMAVEITRQVGRVKPVRITN
jgi:hypothetical protein